MSNVQVPTGSLQWRHNEHNGVSNYRRPDCLLNRLFRRRSKKTPKLHVTGLCEGNSPVTGEFPAHRTSNAINFSIWWRHHHTIVVFVTLSFDIPMWWVLQAASNSRSESHGFAVIIKYFGSIKLGHDDVIKWKHFPRCWPFVRGIHRSPVNSPHKGQWRCALMFSLICVWINSWVNNREAGDLRRCRAHYDVTVMWHSKRATNNVYYIKTTVFRKQAAFWIPSVNYVGSIVKECYKWCIHIAKSGRYVAACTNTHWPTARHSWTSYW